MFKNCLYFFIIAVSASLPVEARERMSLSRREKEMECIQMQRRLEKKRLQEKFESRPESRPKPTFAPEKIVITPEIAKMRIASLFPEGSPFPLIEPELPKGYHLVLKHAYDTLEEGIFWEKDSTNNDPFFRLSWIKSLRQDVPEHFESENRIMERLQSEGLTDIHIQKMSWGSYPLIVISAEGNRSEEVRRLWIGLNRPDKRLMQVEFIVPAACDSFVEQELQLWEPFLHKTKENAGVKP